MSYSRAMPHIQPYPQEPYAQPNMDNYQAYRQVFHRPIQSSAIAPRQINRHTSDSPVIVPSMATTLPISAYVDYYHHPYYYQVQQNYRQTPTINSQAHPYPQPITVQPPIHHTLENATIAYDTVSDLKTQKDLVKDVFFSPAMTPAYNRATTPESLSSACSQSDSESDSGMSLPLHDDTPTDLLPSTSDEIPLFYFGLELEDEPLGESQVRLSSMKQKPAFSLQLSQFDKAQGSFLDCGSLPTPPHTEHNYGQITLDSLKRKPNHAEPGYVKKQKQANWRASVVPVSQDELLGDTYFASDEDSSDDEDSLSARVARWNGAVDPFGFESTSTHLSASSDSQSFSMGDHQLSSEDEDDESVISLWERQPTFDQESSDDDGCEKKALTSTRAPCRSTSQPTIYQKLTKANVDWCRYCGTTEGVNWRPGPWGKRTLCNKHGCDYKGYGFACKLPRLDLTGFAKESIDDRDRPVLQLFCSGCQHQESWQDNVLVRCEGCPKALHQGCASDHHGLTDAFISSDEPWFCDSACSDNARRKRIVVELPRKRLPLMCAPKNNATPVSDNSTARTRSLRDVSGSLR